MVVEALPLWRLSLCNSFCFFPEFYQFPPLRIGHGIAKHIEEGGLEQGVELGEGLAALGPQGVRRVQDGRNPLLLGDGWEGDLEV